ncbi:MAG: hypothetical protein INQ03_11305 [Candidatus Heimdallarchaeota archaeon]|nr:hypothetical protein [Candidatus Heimdallarchaeota archaeon]
MTILKDIFHLESDFDKGYVEWQQTKFYVIMSDTICLEGMSRFFISCRDRNWRQWITRGERKALMKSFKKMQKKVERINSRFLLKTTEAGSTFILILDLTSATRESVEEILTDWLMMQYDLDMLETEVPRTRGQLNWWKYFFG